MAYWITTHWPGPVDNTKFSRHVYLNSSQVRYPDPGEIVFVRKARTVRGKARPTVNRHFQNQTEKVQVIDGSGGLIGRLRVKGNLPRTIGPEDCVNDYGGSQSMEYIGM